MSKNKKTIGILYISILLLSLFCNTQSKIFHERVKEILKTRKQTVSLLQDSSDSLKDAFKGFFKIGTSVSPHELNGGGEFIKKHFNSITPENELKPDSIINQQQCQFQGNNVNTQVVFGSGTSATLKFCESNGIPLRGHTFVWYSQTPDWFFKENFNSGGNYVSTNIMDQRLESFIKNTFALLAKDYPKLEVYSYDVANELFVNDGGGMRPASNSHWVRVYGDDSFVVKAFTYARKYAPKGCKLYLNDYNEYMPAKTDDIYNMAMKLKELGVIDGIGMQSHLDVSYPSGQVYKTAVEKFLSTGLDVQITELDITCKDFNSQASLFKEIFQIAVDNYKRIPAVTVWGTNDSISWRSSQNPLLFSQGYQPKPAFEAVIEVAKAAAANTKKDDKSDETKDDDKSDENKDDDKSDDNKSDEVEETPTSFDTLKEAFRGKFKIGTSVSPHELNGGGDFIKKHFNSITPENELKPDSIINQQQCQFQGNNVNTQVSFGSGTQATLKFCESNGIPLRGHTFVWYSQTPDWFFKENFNSGGNYVSTNIMDQRLESFIKNTFDILAKDYPNLEVYSYDIANELFLNDGGGMRGADNSHWVRVYGDDSFVIKAFTYARKYAPKGCKLYLNDYNEYIPAKTSDIYNMAMKLKENNLIDGIGMQSHLDVSYPSASVYKTALEKFISTGLDVQITELDITTNNFSAQASLYKEIFQLAVDNAKHIPAVTVWGTNDSISWRGNQNPLLFSQGYQPKEAYSAVIEVAKAAAGK